MITIYGRATSSNVQLVMWAVAELDLAHERIDRGGPHGGTDSPEHLAMNPMGLIPVLVDGDLAVWESAAILRYLGARYGDDGFWPRDPARRAELDQWAEWIKQHVAPALITGVFWQLVRTPPAERDHARIEAETARLARLMPLADRRIGAGPYLNGDHLSFADIMLGHVLYRYFTLELDRVDTPDLRAYYDRLTDRPAYREHVMVSYESLRAR